MWDDCTVACSGDSYNLFVYILFVCLHVPSLQLFDFSWNLCTLWWEHLLFWNSLLLLLLHIVLWPQCRGITPVYNNYTDRKLLVQILLLHAYTRLKVKHCGGVARVLKSCFDVICTYSALLTMECHINAWYVHALLNQPTVACQV